MLVQIFSDIHGDLKRLSELVAVDADYYVAAGDLVSWGRGLGAAGHVLEERAGRTFVLPGNHESEEQIEEFCAKFGLQPLHGRSVELDGVHLAGIGYSSPTPFNTPGEYTEEEMAARLTPLAGLDPMVLICHCPPLDTPLDRASSGQHIGSRAIRDFILREQPRAFYCGHVHETAGTAAKLGASIGRNVGKRGHLADFAKL